MAGETITARETMATGETVIAGKTVTTDEKASAKVEAVPVPAVTACD